VRILWKNSAVVCPELSIVLLDWSCRESFHILDYLDKQTVPRTQYEVIWIEYYSRRASKIEDKLKLDERACKRPSVDQWVIMDIPKEVYYHKHLMYNTAILLSRANLVAIVDSDAMVQQGFVGSILQAFQRDEKIVLHLDQFRNVRRDLYPFNCPSFEEVVGEGCINYADGRTVGLADDEDPLHSRNYGACMCARRKDLIAIGGADEHIDYLGHICGPYELTFRLVNFGLREVWLDDEFTYHTWHPGQAGERDYIGPHDGRHVSARALEARLSGRTLPFVENPAIRSLRLHGDQIAVEQSLGELVSDDRLESWSNENVAKLKPRLWGALLSCRRPLVALRLSKTFMKLFVGQARDKVLQVWANAGQAAGVPKATEATTQLEPVAGARLSIVRVFNFAKRILEFCIYATHRSRECLSALAAQGDHEVSFYGTDGIAEILYDLTFEMPVTVKNIYDDIEGKRFHAFKVLPIETCGAAKEKLIVASLVGVAEKVRKLKTFGVSPDRIVILQ
jgi:hypothetical protein